MKIGGQKEKKWMVGKKNKAFSSFTQTIFVIIR